MTIMSRINLLEFNFEDNINKIRYSRDADSLPMRVGRRMAVLLVGGVRKWYE